MYSKIQIQTQRAQWPLSRSHFMPKPISLDRIDHAILAALKEDGRLSFAALSARVHLSARPTQERVRRLEKAGIISGYSATVNLPQAAHPVVLLAQVALGEHVDSPRAFTQELHTNPAVLDCWLVSGTFDFLVRVGCADIQQYRELADGWLANPAFKLEKIVTATELQELKRLA